MTAKEYLSQAFILDKKIKAKEAQLDCLKKHVPYASPVISDMPKGSPPSTSLVEKTVLRITKLEEQIQKQIIMITELESGIQNTISDIGNQNFEIILEMRYLSFMKWEEIASSMGVSMDRAYQIHREALGMIRLPCYL